MTQPGVFTPEEGLWVDACMAHSGEFGGEQMTSLENPAPFQGAGKVSDVSPPGVPALGSSWDPMDVCVRAPI